MKHTFHRYILFLDVRPTLSQNPLLKGHRCISSITKPNPLYVGHGKKLSWRFNLWCYVVHVFVQPNNLLVPLDFNFVFHNQSFHSFSSSCYVCAKYFNIYLLLIADSHNVLCGTDIVLWRKRYVRKLLDPSFLYKTNEVREMPFSVEICRWPSSAHWIFPFAERASHWLAVSFWVSKYTSDFHLLWSDRMTWERWYCINFAKSLVIHKWIFRKRHMNQGKSTTASKIATCW